jgi:hypothetical protein
VRGIADTTKTRLRAGKPAQFDKPLSKRSVYFAVPAGLDVSGQLRSQGRFAEKQLTCS